MFISFAFLSLEVTQLTSTYFPLLSLSTLFTKQICLAYDLDDFDIEDEDDRTWRCVDDDRRNVECPMLNTNNSRRAEAVQDMLDGGENNHQAFYDAFESAWTKATLLGHGDDNLSSLSDGCE